MIKHTHMVDYNRDSMSSSAEREGRKAAIAKRNGIEVLRVAELPRIPAGIPMRKGRVQDINCILTR